MSVTIETIRPQNIDAALKDAWCRVLADQPQFSSPFFHPAYAQRLAEVRPQVEVAVIRNGDRPVGFFPY
ncbi:MAG: cellulose biosynthesis protein CelD, partial [Maioricimonas sp. JB049]